MQTRTSEDGRTVYVISGPWRQIVAMRHVLCEDGRERTIQTRDADTFYTVPGRTHAYGRTVTGFVSYDHAAERMTFTACGKHRDLLTSRAPKTEEIAQCQ